MNRTEYDHAITQYNNRFLTEKLKEIGLKMPEARYLKRIFKTGRNVLMNDIVGESVYHKSNATRAINELVAQGYLLKEKNPEDKRGYLLTLTDIGFIKARKVQDIFKQREDFINSVITDEDREVIKNITRKIYHLFREYYQEEDTIDETNI